MRARLTSTTLLALAMIASCGRVGFDLVPSSRGTDPSDGGRGAADGDAAATTSGGASAAGGRGGTSAGAGGAGGTDGGAVDPGGTTGSGGSLPDGGDVTPDAGGGLPPDAGPPPPACRAGCTCEYYLGARYMLCASPLVRDDAVKACAETDMRVVRIASGEEQSWVRLRSQQAGFGKFHLGADDAAKEGTWVWDDGTPFWQGVGNGKPIGGQFTAWAKGEPNSFVVDENCSEVQSIQGWNDCVCDLTKPTICKATPKSRSYCGDGVVDGTEVCDDARTGQYCASDCAAFVCPSGCSCFTSAGRSVALCATARSFRDADVACGRGGMTLVHLDGQALDDGVRAEATTRSISSYWIGAFDLDAADNWLWTDLTLLWTGTATGTRHAYEHFGAGFPNGAAGQDCAAVTADGTWQNQDCATSKPYVCERL